MCLCVRVRVYACIYAYISRAYMCAYSYSAVYIVRVCVHARVCAYTYIARLFAKCTFESSQKSWIDFRLPLIKQGDT